jgi:hypothetical protein
MEKTEAGVLWYKFDWKAYTNETGNTDWLGTDETISSYSISNEAGITIESSSLTDDSTSVSVLVSGGTPEEYYDITCSIVTTEGQEQDAIITLKII